MSFEILGDIHPKLDTVEGRHCDALNRVENQKGIRELSKAFFNTLSHCIDKYNS
jgi:hypothetical protein